MHKECIYKHPIGRKSSLNLGPDVLSKRFQLFAEAPTEFFLKEVDAQITFEKDSSGKVARLILHQGGQNTPGVKK